MSLAHPSDAPSPAASGVEVIAETPEEGAPGPSLVSVLQMRGAPLLDGLEAHFPGSRDQAEAAGSYAFAAAVELGLDRTTAELIRETAKLHDVGRVYVPPQVLAKPAWSRTPEEGALVEGHHQLGAQLARGAGIPERVCEWIRLGAERYDGGGPSGLAGEAIPLPARISRASYACYAALAEDSTAGGGRRRPRGPADALRGALGRELDPMVVDALETVLTRVREG
jgi:response regulator RpfG family c-di-GMP phosphodiesterase